MSVAASGERVADRPEGLRGLRRGGDIHAAIDLGTNSFHLVVARVDAEGRFDVVAAEKEMVRLGSGAGDMSALTPEAIERGIDTLRRFRQVAESFGADVTAVATSALREAANRKTFLDRAWTDAGVAVEVVSGVEEARLIHLGVIQSLPLFEDRILVVDIGGGSTELLVGRGRDVLSVHSTKLGAIRLTDRFFPGGEAKPKAVKQCRTHVRSFLVPVVRQVREHQPFTPVGSSGTITTVARMVVARRGGDHMAPTNGVEFTAEELHDVVEDVVGRRRPDDRSGIDGLDDRRRDIIVAGVLLLEQIFEGLGLQRMVVSDAALREGILLDLVSRSGEPSFHHLSDIRRQSVLRMAELYHEDLVHIQAATDIALELFDALEPVHGLGLDERDLLEAAGMLHNVGLFISHAAHHKHSYYVVRNTDQLSGFTDREVELIAQVARYHRKSAPKAGHQEFQALERGDQHTVRVLAGLLRIAIALDRTRQGAVRDIGIQVDDELVTISVHVPAGADYSLEQYTADQRKALLASALGRQVRVQVVSR